MAPPDLMFEHQTEPSARPSQARLTTPAQAVPPDIRLIAAVSRLIDLHQCRRDSGVYVPETQERSGAMLGLALIVLDVLREIEMDQGPSLVAITEVLSAVKARVASAAAEDVDFVIDSIAAEREIKYAVEDGDGGLDLGMTKESTPLLEKARGFAQVQLTENARLFLRVASMRESWLYSDVDAERLVKAIERGQFADIPRFCRMMVLEIATKNKQISSALERPALSLRTMLVEFGGDIASSMSTASEVVRKAASLIYAPQIVEQFESWSEASGVQYVIGNLRTEIELVMQNVEALSRRFIKFLEAAQRARPTGATGIPFSRIIEQLTHPDAPIQPDRLAAMLSNLMPWGQRAAFFSPSQLVGAVDVMGLQEDSPAPPTAITIDASTHGPHSRFADFLQRHADLIVGWLRERGSMRLAELIDLTGFAFEAGESPADLFGVYTAPSDANGTFASIAVGLTGEMFDLHIDERRYSGSNPMILLKEDAHGTE